jgi:hypothetical protein
MCRHASYDGFKHMFASGLSHLCVLLLRFCELVLPAALQVVVLLPPWHGDAVRLCIHLELRIPRKQSAHRRAAQEPRDRRQAGQSCASAEKG